MLRVTGAVLILAAIAGAQPALTTIQDTLYRADGTRYSGTIYIAWNSFMGGDSSNIATANLTLPIVNGVLKVRLVPTTTASAGAQYNITYANRGVNQFTEVWAVPPSNVTLRVRDVRVATGTVVGPPAVTTPVQIADVVGLQNELALRMSQGVGFTPGRAAVINSSGQIDGATGNLGDCVRVDGTSGPCGSGGGGILPSFSDGEIPGGTVNGTNQTFTLAFAPSPVGSLELYRNGLLMKQGVDYSVTTNTISFFVASTPQTGDLLVAAYRYADPNNALSSLASPQVVCSSAGTSTTATSPTELGSCTIPAGLLGTGDRIETSFQFSHSGTATGFTGTVSWGGTTVVSRSAGSSESALVGRIAVGVGAGSQKWDSETWGAGLAAATGVGSATVDTSQSVTIVLQGTMASMTSDSLVLSNFTVVRYPAQNNP